jgi:hypothetical protein
MSTAEAPAEAKPAIPAWQFAARILWVAVQLSLVYCLGQKGVLFFYQAF